MFIIEFLIKKFKKKKQEEVYFEVEDFASPNSVAQKELLTFFYLLISVQ